MRGRRGRFGGLPIGLVRGRPGMLPPRLAWRAVAMRPAVPRAWRVRRPFPRRLLVGRSEVLLLAGGGGAAGKFSLADAHRIERAAGKPLEQMSNDELETWMRSAGVEFRPVTSDEQHLAQKAAQTGTLPAHCRSCGAPFDPSQVRWQGSSTAECLYCGTRNKTE